MSNLNSPFQPLPAPHSAVRMRCRYSHVEYRSLPVDLVRAGIATEEMTRASMAKSNGRFDSQGRPFTRKSPTKSGDISIVYRLRDEDEIPLDLPWIERGPVAALYPLLKLTEEQWQQFEKEAQQESDA